MTMNYIKFRELTNKARRSGYYPLPLGMFRRLYNHAYDKKKRFHSLKDIIVQNIYKTVGSYTKEKVSPFQMQRLNKAHFFKYKTHGTVVTIPDKKNGNKQIQFRLDIPEEAAAYEKYDLGLPL